MANNYLQFSVQILHLTPQEEAYWRGVMLRQENEYDEGYTLNYSFRFYGDYVMLYAEEFGDLEILADDIQMFLKKFRPTKRIEVEWAETCSSMRPGEFGGGALLITSYQQYWMSTQSAFEILSRDADATEVGLVIHTE